MLENGAVPSPFIILLDLQMPKKNGLEFLETIRKPPKYASSIVFILTTSKTDEDMIAGYFLKSSAGDGFLDIVHLLQGYWKVVHFPPS
jgi:CheY-like chemotaxis protein